MHTSVFFKLFPPPKFMVMKHAGLDISDDAIRFVQYSSTHRGRSIEKYASVNIPEGVIVGGNVKDESVLQKILQDFDKKHNLSYVKVSVPEEKAYLFQTEVPASDFKGIRQNIEFKLEENVPLSASDAVFYFDIIPTTAVDGPMKASVSVVPKSYIEHYLQLLRGTGIFPVAFEVVPKAIARAIVPSESDKVEIIVNIMGYKTGIYIVFGGVVYFTSTINWGSLTNPSDQSGNSSSDVSILTKEIDRIRSYWMSLGISSTFIEKIVLVGNSALFYEKVLRGHLTDQKIPLSVADAWQNIFDIDKYVPPISREDSLEYVVAAGLAMTT